MSLASNHLVRDDEGAKALLLGRGVHVPPVYEREGDTFRQCFMGWLVVPRSGGSARGAVVLSASADGEDWEMIADGGWYASGAKAVFRYIFEDRQQERVSARCRMDNVRNIRLLRAFGFRQEGVKRLSDGDVALFGMLRSECRLLKGV